MRLHLEQIEVMRQLRGNAGQGKELLLNQAGLGLSWPKRFEEQTL